MKRSSSHEYRTATTLEDGEGDEIGIIVKYCSYPAEPDVGYMNSYIEVEDICTEDGNSIIGQLSEKEIERLTEDAAMSTDY